ncbi:Lecithin-cholesterol acyltransferase [Intoshia linei]|uniref:Lecithin-cholesterol acyltransferase n=1 Tax=Intoshia linei TaxID=1819745 RepID=A0A177AVK8_9BILA|nr:Lecithin-cholesterol acyltransferase [Intoshia linei]
MFEKIFNRIFVICVIVPTLALWDPIIFIPGDGGTKLEAKLTNAKVDSFKCEKNHDWFLLWVSVEELVPFVSLECFLERMTLEYNSTDNRRGHNRKGVEIRVAGNSYGNVSSIEYLSEWPLVKTEIFNGLIEPLKNMGYVDGFNLRGAPYDFRHAPDEKQIQLLRNLIIETYEINKKKKVILVAHSMGGIILNILLRLESKKWKEKYIKKVITISTPWGGTMKTLKLITTGDNLGIFVVNGKELRDFQRSMQSTMLLLPSKIWGNDPVILSQGKNYTAFDYASLFKDINFQEGYERYKTVETLLNDVQDMDVELICTHGIDVDTLQYLDYRNTNISTGTPTSIYEKADGTVNLKSLKYCQNWKNTKYVTFQKSEHNGILHDKQFIKFFMETIFKEDPTYTYKELIKPSIVYKTSNFQT